MPIHQFAAGDLVKWDLPSFHPDDLEVVGMVIKIDKSDPIKGDRLQIKWSDGIVEDNYKPDSLRHLYTCEAVST
jgi:hypothetical protein